MCSPAVMVTAVSGCTRLGFAQGLAQRQRRAPTWRGLSREHDLAAAYAGLALHGMGDPEGAQPPTRSKVTSA